MRIHVKICGMTDVAGAVAAAQAGTDAIGFIFDESVRRVTPDQATEIASHLPDDIDRVAVFLSPALDEIERTLKLFTARLAQADHASVAGTVSFQALPVFRESAGVFDRVSEYIASSPNGRFVYEGERSGIGQTVDWAEAHRIGRLGRMTLAGGLTPDNVGEAIRTVRPFGVDVSSGVESGPGVKDPGRIRAFVEAVRETEKDLVTT